MARHTALTARAARPTGARLNSVRLSPQPWALQDVPDSSDDTQCGGRAAQIQPSCLISRGSCASTMMPQPTRLHRCSRACGALVEGTRIQGFCQKPGILWGCSVHCFSCPAGGAGDP